MPIEGINRSKRVPSFSIKHKGLDISMQPACAELKIDNKTVPQSAIESLVLDQVIGAHSALAIELRRKQDLEKSFGNTLEANARAWISKTISLKIDAADKSAGDKGEVNFIGVIVAASMGSKVGSLGNIYLKCLSPTVMLDTTRIYRTWIDRTSNEIINSLISSEGLPNVNVSASGGTKLPGFVAYGQTPLQIINYLAGFEGWWAYYDGTNYNITKELPNDTIELKANQVSAFVVTLDSLGVKKLGTRAFEYNSGRWFQGPGKAPASSSHVLGKAVADSSPLSSSEEFLDIKHVPPSQADLDKHLQNAMSGNYSHLLRGTGLSDRLGIVIGKILKLKWEGQKKQTESRREEGLSGQYLITRVVHRYDDGKYTCEFNCVDRDLAFPYYDESDIPDHIYETAEVTDNNDPDKLGQVKVRFGWSGAGGEDETPFIRVSQAMAGSTPHGSWMLPETGDSVLVSLRGHHLDKAMVIGSLYDGSRLPRNDLVTQDNMTKSFYTKSGNEIIFKDDKDAEQVMIKAKGGACQIALDASNGKEMLSLAVKDNAASIVLDDGGGASKVSITTKSSGCELTLDGQNQSIKIAAKKTIELKATEIKINADAKLEVKSSGTMKHSAGATLDLEGSAMVNVKGGIIKLN